jgi:hypothetical protein
MLAQVGALPGHVIPEGAGPVKTGPAVVYDLSWLSGPVGVQP